MTVFEMVDTRVRGSCGEELMVPLVLLCLRGTFIGTAELFIVDGGGGGGGGGGIDDGAVTSELKSSTDDSGGGGGGIELILVLFSNLTLESFFSNFMLCSF